MFPCMKLRHLEELFQCIDEFEKPNIKLEQYVTPPHLASHMLFTIQSQYGDITGKHIADLGAGCGSVAIGAAALDAGHVVGFEIDENIINTFVNNLQEQELTNVDLVLCDITKEIPDLWSKKFDTVIMNPPFGTKHNAGIDMVFLKKAIEICSGVVYSLHKSSTRSHVLKVAAQCGARGEVLAELRYNLSSTYKFHKKKSVDIEVDFLRFEVQPSNK